MSASMGHLLQEFPPTAPRLSVTERQNDDDSHHPMMILIIVVKGGFRRESSHADQQGSGGGQSDAGAGGGVAAIPREGGRCHRRRRPDEGRRPDPRRLLQPFRIEGGIGGGGVPERFRGGGRSGRAQGLARQQRWPAGSVRTLRRALPCAAD